MFHHRQSRTRDTVLLTGWLFADLLLALFVIFLAANTSGIKAAQPTPTPTATATFTPTPTPTLPPTPTPTPNNRVLEHNYCRIKLDVGDPYTFISFSINDAVNKIQPQLDQVTFLKGRKVGIAIAYGGANDGGQDRGVKVAHQVYAVLKYFAEHSNSDSYTVFGTASLYEDLFTGFENPNTAIINVFLVARPNSSSETCDATTHLPL